MTNIEKLRQERDKSLGTLEYLKEDLSYHIDRIKYCEMRIAELQKRVNDLNAQIAALKLQESEDE